MDLIAEEFIAPIFKIKEHKIKEGYNPTNQAKYDEVFLTCQLFLQMILK